MESPKYQPISCALYDELILLIQKQKEVKLTYGSPENSTSIRTIIQDIFTLQKEEFIRIAKDQTIRLDLLLMIDDIPVPDFC